MNFFEQELLRLFRGRPEFVDAKYFGRACIIPIDKELKVKAEFVDCGTMDQYEALKLTVINRTDGVVDQLTLRFSDYFKKIEVGGCNVVPHIWICNGRAEWYKNPSNIEMESLTDDACDYVGIFDLQEHSELEM